MCVQACANVSRAGFWPSVCAATCLLTGDRAQTLAAVLDLCIESCMDCAAATTLQEMCVDEPAICTIHLPTRLAVANVYLCTHTRGPSSPPRAEMQP